MRVDLKGQTAVVTGGANGIGRAIAVRLAENGARVAIIDVASGADSSLAGELSAEAKQPGAVAVWQGDVSDRPRMESLAAEIEATVGPVSILINNAGINTLHDRRTIEAFHPDDWERILRVDLTGVYVTSQAFLPPMLERGQGRVVNIASVAGLVPLRLQSAYVAAKAGVVNLSRSMALELGPRGVLTNCICPGSIVTRGTRALFYGEGNEYLEKAKSLLAHVPVGRPGTPEEIAHAALFLVSPGATYVNGAVLTVDGGWTAGYTREW